MLHRYKFLFKTLYLIPLDEKALNAQCPAE